MAKAPVRKACGELDRRIDGGLASLHSRNQLRKLGAIEGVNLCSNDYLGLATDPRLGEAVASAIASGMPVGSTGSRLLSGDAEIWEQLESEIAEFMNFEAALYFNSGYSANVGVLSALIQPGDVVFSDSANHASIIDGLRLAGARKVIFAHCDVDSLERELRADASIAAQKFVVTESIFSMDGDSAPISDLVAVSERYGAELIIDEAHATGVVGPQGRGLVAAHGLSDRVLITIHPCGKALAGMGCFVCSSEKLKQYLVNRARTFIFSTALPPYIAAQMRIAIRIVASSDRERNDLAALSAFLRTQLRNAGFEIGRGDSQIIPIFLGENERAIRYSELLCEAGFGVRPIRPPSVPTGTARLRMSVNAKLSTDILNRLSDVLGFIREGERAPSHAVRL